MGDWLTDWMRVVWRCGYECGWWLEWSCGCGGGGGCVGGWVVTGWSLSHLSWSIGFEAIVTIRGAWGRHGSGSARVGSRSKRPFPLQKGTNTPPNIFLGSNLTSNWILSYIFFFYIFLFFHFVYFSINALLMSFFFYIFYILTLHLTVIFFTHSIKNRTLFHWYSYFRVNSPSWKVVSFGYRSLDVPRPVSLAWKYNKKDQALQTTFANLPHWWDAVTRNVQDVCSQYM